MRLLRPSSPLIALLALGLAATDTPWPGGAPPDAVQLKALTDAAEETWRKDRLQEFASSLEDQQEVEIVGILATQIEDQGFDLETVQHYGHLLFQLSLRRDLGLGGAAADLRLRPVHAGVAPGPDAHSCDGCHMVGGQDGAGSFAQGAFLMGDGERLSTVDARNAPSLLGLGLVQALGAEMTAALQGQRAAALERAKARGEPVEAALTAKGVAFGRLVAYPDGRVDAAAVQGVDPDLVVRPFGWKGDQARLRRFVEEAARLHFSLQTPLLEESARLAPDPARLGGGAWPDPDGDGVYREMEEGILTCMAVYLAMLETPVLLPPSDPGLQARWAAGSAAFQRSGCAECHVPSLKLDDRTWEEHADAPGAAPVRLNLLADGDAPRGTDQVALFSDLRRHDMGPGLADRNEDPGGIPRSHFLTRPLWGLAETAPYLHDGRALTLPDAILAHGGDAQDARDAFAALSADEQRDLTIYLLSLTRQPRVRIAR